MISNTPGRISLSGGIFFVSQSRLQRHLCQRGRAVAVSVAEVHGGKDPLPVVRLIMGIVLIEILLMDQQIMEAMVLLVGDPLHMFLYLIQRYFIDDDIILNKDDILAVVHPEVPGGGVGRLLPVQIIGNTGSMRRISPIIPMTP